MYRMLKLRNPWYWMLLPIVLPYAMTRWLIIIFWLIKLNSDFIIEIRRNNLTEELVKSGYKQMEKGSSNKEIAVLLLSAFNAYLFWKQLPS